MDHRLLLTCSILMIPLLLLSCETFPGASHPRAPYSTVTECQDAGVLPPELGDIGSSTSSSSAESIIRGLVYCSRCQSDHKRRGVSGAMAKLTCPGESTLSSMTDHHGRFTIESRHTLNQNCTVSLDYTTLPPSCNAPVAGFGEKSSGYAPILGYINRQESIYVVPPFIVQPSSCQ